MTGRRRGTTGWGELLLTSGLAAGIATIGSYGADRAKADREAWTSRCVVAGSFLSDETPSPYMDERMRRRVTQTAADRLVKCMTEAR